MRRSKRSTSGVGELGWQLDAKGTEDGVDEFGAGRRAVLAGPDGVEVVPAGAQRLGERVVCCLQPGRAQRVREHGSPQLFALAAARVHEQGAPEVERDGPQHGPSVPEDVRVTSRTPLSRRTPRRKTRPRYETFVSRGVCQSSADAPSRATQTAGAGLWTSMRLRSMLPHAGHMSSRASRGAPSGVRKRWRHSPHWYSLLPGTWYSLQEATMHTYPKSALLSSGQDPVSLP